TLTERLALRQPECLSAAKQTNQGCNTNDDDRVSSMECGNTQGSGRPGTCTSATNNAG
ncbi:MAG: hypothetical protein RL033_918, partial [Pseudomonadota bacterium]